MGLYDMFVPRPHQVEETRSALDAAQDPTKDNGPVHRVVRMLVDIGLEGRGPIRSADQIDTLIAQSAKSLRAGGPDGPAQDVVLERVAGGLMSLRQRTRRTLTLLACIPSTWQLIKERATDTVQDRFREATQLKTIPSAEVARDLVEKRFTWHFDETGYHPPYPSWPVRPAVFDGAVGFTPRQLLIKIDAHIQACLAAETVTELGSVGAPPEVTLIELRA